MRYSVKEAKDKFSEVIRAAEAGEPQIIRRHDREVAVVVSIDDWTRANGTGKSFVEIMRSSPLVGANLDFSRPAGFPRDVDFGE